MQHILIGAFDHYDEAEQVKRELMSSGVSQTDIQLAASNDISMSEDTALRTDTTYDTRREDQSLGDRISEFFHSIFSDEDATSQRYAEAVRHGSTVVTVTVNDDDQVSVVEEIMEHNGAIDIDERSAGWGLQHTEQLSSAETATTTSGTAERTAIPIMEEQLKVGKRENALGRVRIVSRMTERPVEETVSLTEQHAVVERRPVDRPASQEELSTFREGTIEIQETAEEPVVSKTARVVEEVMVGKETTQHEETVHDTVRRTDVDIERDSDIRKTRPTAGDRPIDPDTPFRNRP
ncbi:YsnF/AvaK domain-containing protein [Azotobacter chroococcum]|uniref:YsnF/AvaK domain-containing protein n=1 Tax=Azotobacter chroococcum TaxID=353 RepID=A0AAQ0BZJ3_9GAMM|nr:YsnF/AvaK domain-containing protein [Azotobacter chroococcum]QQE89502.1 YsnF/AvaK domain-containing protein [Azotobacter chroococcum]